MKRYCFNLVVSVLVLAAALIGCIKKHDEEKPAAIADKNIVTLTKANLEHVEIKTEPVARGSLSTTLRAPGRGERKSQKPPAVDARRPGEQA
jgi:hypothetical protein